HDDNGGDVRRGAARDRLWRGCGVAAAARDYNRRRAAREPAADALHDPRHLSLPGPPPAMDATPLADPSAPTCGRGPPRTRRINSLALGLRVSMIVGASARYSRTWRGRCHRRREPASTVWIGPKRGDSSPSARRNARVVL